MNTSESMKNVLVRKFIDWISALFVYRCLMKCVFSSKFKLSTVIFIVWNIYRWFSRSRQLGGLVPVLWLEGHLLWSLFICSNPYVAKLPLTHIICFTYYECKSLAQDITRSFSSKRSRPTLWKREQLCPENLSLVLAYDLDYHGNR